MGANPLTRREFIAATAIGGSSAAISAQPSPAVSLPQAAGDLSGKPAILGGTPVRTQRFPSWPMIGEVDEQKLLDSLRRREWCRLGGTITTEFE
jgi:hypothetical protein